jgi:hypothetical protein
LADLIKAFVLFTFGFVIVVNVGDKLADRSPQPGAAIRPAETEVAGTHAAEKEEPTAERSNEAPIPRSGSYAEACAAFDPIARPEEVLDILEYASSVTGTPVDVLYAIWRNETGHVAGAGKASGSCNMREQLKIRCVVGGNCKHLSAMEKMGARFRWDMDGMTCSCGTATLEVNTRYFGGCCGPFQFSGAEIVDNAMAHGLDPMTFCGGAILAGWELKDHHDRFLRKGVASTETEAWRKAISRYFGADRENRYWRKAYAQWNMFHEWYRQGPEFLRRKVTEKSVYSARYHSKLRAARATFASY